ncbi:ABC transporter substrate-binding protein [Peristeroidobacter soli]|jgi:iron(III) transport system substrate-binding protein|uniref:ABC transporter substrate-binding protein n=1 Tax=Peristeroidobacter soli TaxID=2497877 RepID=UPI001C37A915|nr:ABC transporter substrate-binding protein [Peristeroidobacter soli]
MLLPTAFTATEAMMRLAKTVAAAVLLLATALSAIAAVPPSYPRSYANRIADANEDGRLSIYSTTDAREVAQLLQDFRSLYPRIRVEYFDINSTELYNRFIAEVAAKEASADLLWSSAMDLQIKLVNDGYAQAYASPEKPNLPAWAIWKNEAYGTTAEPVVLVYNKRLVPAAEVPHTRADLERLLTDNPSYVGKVAMMDPERSGAGFLYMTQDLRVTRDNWRLVHAMGRAKVQFYSSTGAMLERVASGEHLLAYNTIGPYALERAARDPAIGVILPSDYTLVASRIALIPADARHPDAAKLFLDYLLSRRGQAFLAQKHMTPVRSDVDAPPGTHIDAPNMRAIRVGPELLANLDQIKRLRFLKDWRNAVNQD